MAKTKAKPAPKKSAAKTAPKTGKLPKVALYTCSFLSDPYFTGQVELTSVDKFKEVVCKEAWFDEYILASLGATQKDVPKVLYQLQQLDELINTWIGFFGFKDNYVQFSIVRVDTETLEKTGHKFNA